MEEQTGIVAEAPVEAPEVVEVQPAESIAEHAAQYDPKRQAERDAAAASASATEPTTGGTAAAPPKFDASKAPRHRAQKDRATAADAPRILELNRKLKEANDQIARLSAAPQPPAPQPAAQRAPAPQVAPLPQPTSKRRWLADPSDPEPMEKDFGGDPMKYLDARYEWLARGVNRYDRAEVAQQQHVIQRSISWGQRVEKAIQDPRFPNYAEIAFQPAPWAEGSPVDRFIDADDNGAEVLYHLQAHPEERDAVLRMPVHQQLKHLALLSQRYDTASIPSVQAGVTGSVARTNIRILPSRPPNPVRTGAQSASGGPPPTDGSLSIADHAKQFGRQSRR